MPQKIRIKQIEEGELTSFINGIVAAEIGLLSSTYPLPTGIYSTGISFGAVFSGAPTVYCSISIPNNAPIIQSYLSGVATTSGVGILLSNQATQTGYFLNIFAGV